MDVHFKSATEIARLIRERKVSALEVLEHFLARVARFNPGLNAIIWLDAERARARAKAADAALAKGKVWGPLHGVPMTIKESYNVAGSPTTWGDPKHKNNVSETNALAVDRLESAGAVLFGKTNVPLLLADNQSYNAIYGTTNNPWDLSRTPGGSSGGSAAALAAGLTGIDAGSDIGGSVRNPAHFCGVFTHKPTWGVVAPKGQALPGSYAYSDISVIGPMTRGADDLEVALDAMAGPDEIDAFLRNLYSAAPGRDFGPHLGRRSPAPEPAGRSDRSRQGALSRFHRTRSHAAPPRVVAAQQRASRPASHLRGLLRGSRHTSVSGERLCGGAARPGGRALAAPDHRQRQAGAHDPQPVLGRLLQPRLSAVDGRPRRSDRVAAAAVRISGDRRERPRQDRDRLQPLRRKGHRRLRSAAGFRVSAGQDP